MVTATRILKLIVLSAGLMVAACGALPADPNNTTETVEQENRVRVGYVAGEDDAARGEMEALARLVAEAHGATIAAEEDTTDALMERLEKGELDIVIGVWAKKNPWSKHAAFTSAWAERKVKKDEPVVRGAVHLGENKWLLSIDRAIEEQGP